MVSGETLEDNFSFDYASPFVTTPISDHVLDIDPGISPKTAVNRCFSQILECDIVHAHIDSTDCYGTLSELGAASAFGKPIYLVFSPELEPGKYYEEHWIILQPLDRTSFPTNGYPRIDIDGIYYGYGSSHQVFKLDSLWEEVAIQGYQSSDFELIETQEEKAYKSKDGSLCLLRELTQCEHRDELWFIKHLPSVVHWCYGTETTIHPNLLFKTSKPPRPKISKSLRYDILKSAKFRCQACGVTAADSQMHIDHIYPRSQGGKDDVSNYTVLCEACNNGKRAKVPDSDIAQRLKLNQFLNKDHFRSD
jgi:5-methylcytosine-specific restriction endonuclease McrA/nucleoside 2-deoxyribosyltransferase